MKRREESSYSSSEALRSTEPRFKLIPVDYPVIGYCTLFSIFILLSDNPVSAKVPWILFDVLAIAYVLLISRVDPIPRSVLANIARRYYFILLFAFFYRQTGPVVHLLFDGWFDQQIIDVEMLVLGFQPVLFIERLYYPLVNELIIGAYVSYYFWLPVCLLWLVITKRLKQADNLMLASASAFVLSFIMFALYPAQGPRWHLADSFTVDLNGLFFVPLVKAIMNKGAVHGGAMPSSHSAVALIVFIIARRESRLAGLALAPICAGILIGCVWGRFHYVSDVIVGGIIAAIAIWFTDTVSRHRFMGISRLIDT
jgi:membrane-associated phospholipid phosphatase